jgi:hypothetical protein
MRLRAVVLQAYRWRGECAPEAQGAHSLRIDASLPQPAGDW